MYNKIFIVCAILAGTVTYIEAASDINNMNNTKCTNWKFKDYLNRYHPRTIWEKIDKMKKNGLNLTVKQEVDLFIKGIDMTDDFLKLKVQDGDPKLLVMKDGRRWRPPPGVSDFYYDKFDLRRRLFELMKQAIYQARNKMVIMQMLRQKYSLTSLYKMGYLMSKTDQACKTFSKVAYRAYRACSLARQSVSWRHRVYGVLASEERVLNLWFTVDLLVDLIKKNDHYCKEMLAKGTKHPKEEWKFTD